MQENALQTRAAGRFFLDFCHEYAYSRALAGGALTGHNPVKQPTPWDLLIPPSQEHDF
jgi:hypothetical protein